MAVAKKKNAVSASNPILNKVILELRKKYGEEVLRYGSDVEEDLGRTPSGIFAFDFSTGGGPARGKVTIFRGKEASGKSLTSYYTIINTLYHDKHAKAAVIEPEGSLDDTFLRLLLATNFNADNKVIEDILSRIVSSRPETLEEGIEVYESLLTAGEFDIMLYDSIAASTPSTERDESMDDWQRGLGARLWNKAFRRIQSYINRGKKMSDKACACIFINQPRFTMTQYGDPTTYPGGRGQFHAAHMIVDFNNPQWIKSGDERSKEKTLTHGQKIIGFTEKNKTFPGHKYFNYTYYFEDLDEHRAYEIDNVSATFDLGLLYGTVEQAGSSYTLYIPKKKLVKTIGKPRTQLVMVKHKITGGKEKVFAALREDPEMLTAIQDTLVKTVMERKKI